MPIEFICPKCGKPNSAPDGYEGFTGPCQACGETITVPTASGSPPKKPSGSSTTTVVLAILGVVALLFFIAAGLLVALLAPAITTARSAALRVQSSNNLKQIALALHNYHDVYQTFPSAYVPNDDGSPRTSWRVALLPYLNEEPLGKTYNYHVNWDDPANAAVAQTIVPIYQSPSSSEPPGNTSYFMLVGPKAFGEGGKWRGISSIIDGSANSIAIVEVEGLNVPWTKPQDITLAEFQDLVASGQVGSDKGGFNAAFCDGSVRFIPLPIDPTLLESLSTINGRELIDPAEIP